MSVCACVLRILASISIAAGLNFEPLCVCFCAVIMSFCGLIYVILCMHIHVHAHEYMIVCMHIAYMRACTSVHTVGCSKCGFACIHACMLACVCACVFVCVCIFICVCVCVCVCGIGR